MDCGTLRLVPRECRTSREGELSMSTAPTRDLRPLAGRAAATPSWPEQSCARGSNRRNAGATSGPKRTAACRSQRERARHGGDTSSCATRCSTRAYGRSTPFRMPTKLRNSGGGASVVVRLRRLCRRWPVSERRWRYPTCTTMTPSAIDASVAMMRINASPKPPVTTRCREGSRWMGRAFMGPSSGAPCGVHASASRWAR